MTSAEQGVRAPGSGSGQASGVALVADLVCILVFAAVGRVSHGESLGPVGLAVTAWPFGVGCLLGSLAAVRRRRPFSVVSGTVVLVATVLIGMALRALVGAGVQVSFVVVTVVVLGIFLLGWRGVRALLRRGRTVGDGGRRGAARTGETG